MDRLLPRAAAAAFLLPPPPPPPPAPPVATPPPPWGRGGAGAAGRWRLRVPARPRLLRPQARSLGSSVLPSLPPPQRRRLRPRAAEPAAARLSAHRQPYDSPGSIHRQLRSIPDTVPWQQLAALQRLSHHPPSCSGYSPGPASPSPHGSLAISPAAAWSWHRDPA